MERGRAVKKLSCIIISVLLLISVPVMALGDRDYVVGAFYAISSSGEYKSLPDSTKSELNHMYFQWARVVPDENGTIRFTNRYLSHISSYDNWSEFGVPGNSVNGYVNKIDYKKKNPQGKAFLSVFFSASSYGNGRHSGIEFLNMTVEDWNQNIISPLVAMVNGHYNGTISKDLAFDGVVLDFEGIRNSYDGYGTYPAEQRTDLKNKYVAFLHQLKAALGDKELIVVVSPSNVVGYFDGYDYKAISEIADYIFIMAYDYHHFNIYDATIKELQGKIRSVSRYETQPYSLVDEAVNKAINQYRVDPQKIILGLNLHGTKWVKVSSNINGQAYSYYVLSHPYASGIETAVEVDPIYLEDSKTCKKVLIGEEALKMAEGVNLNGGQVESVEYYYESPRSLYEKYGSIVRKYSIAGVAAWRLGAGSINTWGKLANMLKEGAYGSLEDKTGVAPSKEWTVKFNMPLDPSSVNNQTIYVVDEWGYPVDVELTLGEDSCNVVIKPVTPYREGHKYELIISKELRGASGEALKQPMRMRFSIASQEK